ncbi:MAG: acyl carrier protein [Sphingomonadales bacterium]
MGMEEITLTVRDYILSQFLPGENPDNLTSSTELITSGVLDSLATLRLVAFLEDSFGIETEPHELDPANLNTIADVTNFVLSKQ